jgi:hypothetical protein
MSTFDTSAPFAGLVIAIDSLTFEHQYSRKHPTRRGALYGVDVHSFVPGEIPVTHRGTGMPTGAQPTPSDTLVTMNEVDA